jgi:hypothetical protein
MGVQGRGGGKGGSAKFGDTQFQLGGAFGSKVIVVPGLRSAGWSLRCSTNVTWKELKTWLFEVSQSRYALECGAYPMRMQGQDRA